jgi:hypothetical protein
MVEKYEQYKEKKTFPKTDIRDVVGNNKVKNTHTKTASCL